MEESLQSFEIIDSMTRMEWINYHHLLYFYVAARDGGISKAAGVLHLSRPTISGQIRRLEQALGEKLFERSGRRLILTEMGRVVYRYASEIFGLGQEMVDTLRGRPGAGPSPLVVGVADVLPKIIVRRMLAPALRIPEPIRLVCREDKPARLLADLVSHSLDVVLTDAPVGAESGIRAYNHFLGECGTVLLGSPRLAARLRPGFPRSLHGAPLLIPLEHTAIRRSLETWLDARGIRPEVVGEFDDSALMKAFGQDGLGVLIAPKVIEAEICRQYRLRRIGVPRGVRGRFYAISVERRIRHPAVAAITEGARRKLFA